MIASGRIGIASIPIGARQLRIETDCLAVVGHCTHMVAPVRIRDAALPIGSRQPRIEANGLIVVGDGAAIVTLVVVRVLGRRRAISLIVRQVLRPGIGQTDLRCTCEASLPADLQTVIVGIELRRNDRD